MSVTPDPPPPQAPALEPPAPAAEPARTTQRLLGLLWVAPVLSYFATVAVTMQNVPFMDDYDALLDHVSRFVGGTWSSRWQLWMEPHNDHLIGNTRLAGLLDYYTFGRLDFRHLILLGNLLLLAMFLLLRRVYRDGVRSPGLLALALALLLFELRHWETNLAATNALSNYGVVLLAALSLWWLAERENAPLAAYLLAWAACFSQANGLLAFGIGTLWLLGRRRWLLAGLWALGTAACLLLHLWAQRQFRPGEAEQELVQSVRDWQLIPRFFAALVGDLAYRLPVAQILGVALLAAMVALVVRRAWRPRPGVLLIGAFLLGSAAALVPFRAQHGLEHALSSRYSVYSLGLACLVLAEIWRLARPGVGPGLAACLLLLLLNQALTRQARPEIEARFVRNARLADCGADPAARFNYVDPARAEGILREANRLGVYRSPVCPAPADAAPRP